MLPSRFVDFEDNELYYHLNCWYLEALSDGKSTLQIRAIIRIPEVKRSPMFDFFESLLHCF